MRKAFLIYLFQISAISIILSFSAYFFFTYGYPSLKTNSVYWLIGIFFSVNLGFHSLLLFTAEKKSEAFIRRFLAATVIKLFVYLIFILVFIFGGAQNPKVFLISFLILYLIYTSHEVTAILSYLKKFDNNSSKSK